MVIGVLSVGNGPLIKMEFVTENWIVLGDKALPAVHSPGVAPEAVSEFAAVIASRKVQKPSLPFATSDKLLTVMVEASGVMLRLSAANRADEE